VDAAADGAEPAAEVACQMETAARLKTHARVGHMKAGHIAWKVYQSFSNFWGEMELPTECAAGCKSNACLYGSLPCMDVNVNLVIDCSYKWCMLQAGRKEWCVRVTE